MIRRELGRFLIVGTSTVLVDFVTYRAVLASMIGATDLSKATGFVAGTTFAYVANRFWTFGHATHRAGSAHRFAVLYASTLGANVLVNSLALHLLAGAAGAVQMAFLLATGVSASLNFAGMKFFVFRPTSPPPERR